MKKWSIGILVLLCSTILIYSCSKDDDNDYTLDQQTFVTQAASGNVLEIQAGQLAVQKGQNAQVKAYGQHMVADHTLASAELAALATSKGLSVSTQLMAQHQQQYNVLTPLTGTAFDKAFATLMVQSHQEQVNLFDMAADEVNDADLRGFAADKLPTLEAHLQEAQQLNATVNP